MELLEFGRDLTENFLFNSMVSHTYKLLFIILNILCRLKERHYIPVSRFE